MRQGRLLSRVLAGVLVVGLNTGCGSIGWLITPRSEVSSYTVPRTRKVQVRSMPEGATVFVDGAEAGVTPREVSVKLTEVRSQRRQSIVPGVIGLGLDILLFGALVGALVNTPGSGEAVLPVAGIGAGSILLGTHLIFGRSVVDEAADFEPVAVDIGVRLPGHAEEARRIRVPDLTRVDFLLAPEGAPAAPPRTDARN